MESHPVEEINGVTGVMFVPAAAIDKPFQE